MAWFEKLTGCPELDPDQVRRYLTCEGTVLRSKLNGLSWECGHLEVLSLGQLRARVGEIDGAKSPLIVEELVANVQDLHRDKLNENAMFQVASQFNLLEMTSPEVTPEAGVGIYEQDYTQGPACAIAAGAGTIFRNYFVPVNGRIGQTRDNQIDCLSGIGKLLGNLNNRLWKMVNGYALPTADGLMEINRKISQMAATSLDELREALQVGIVWQTQVTLDGASHRVSQVYCSAVPVAYTNFGPELWEPFATLILDAAYEATFCAGILNRVRYGNTRLFLTLLGGGAFGNRPTWIIDAIRRCLLRYSASGLNVSIVSYGRSNHDVRELVEEFA